MRSSAHVSGFCVAALLLVVTFACVRVAPRPAPRNVGLAPSASSAPFVVAVPPLAESAPSAADLSLPTVTREALQSGVELWHVNVEGAPLAHVRVVVGIGTSTDGALPGMAEVMARAMLLGAQSGTTGLESITGETRLTVAQDGTVFAVNVARSDADSALESLGAMLRTPAFRKQDVLQATAHARAAREHVLPRAPMDVATSLLWSHGAGAVSGANAFRIEDWQCRAQHKKLIRPDKVAVIVVGDVPLEEARQRLSAAFEGWTAPRGTPPPTTEEAKPASLILMDRPEPSRRALLVAGGPAAPREAVPALWLAARILERRTSDAPESHSARSAARLWATAPPFAIVARPAVPHVAQQVTELRGLVKQLADTPPTADELRRARADVNHTAALALGDASTLADALEHVARSRCREDAFADLGQRIAAVSPEDVSASVRKHVPIDQLRIIVVAPRSQTEEALRALGSVEVLTP